MKFLLTLLASIAILMPSDLFGAMCMMYPPPPPPKEPNPPPPPPPGGNPNNPSTKGVKKVGKKFSKMNNSVFKPKGAKITKSGEFAGIENIRLDSSFSLTSFDDSSDSVNSSGHLRDYGFTLTGDLTEQDTISLGYSNLRYETGSAQGILSRSHGVSLAWHHSLTENYGFGAFGLWNEVDTEEINGNSHSYAYGGLFTTYHEFEYFDLSTVYTVAYVDFDTGYDLLFLASATISKQFTDSLGGYVTLSFQDSWKKDPDEDPTYGSWEIGAVYSFTDNFALQLGYERTEFLNNYSDNTLTMNISWLF